MKQIKYWSSVILLLATAITCIKQERCSNIGPEEEQWALLTRDVTATVYHAVPSQCNEDCLHTASMMTVVPQSIPVQRILAMERTMMAQYGISYGDIVRIEGTGIYDGAWQVQDTMNKRFAGQHKVDLLIRMGDQVGKWSNVSIYVAANKPTADKYARQMKI